MTGFLKDIHNSVICRNCHKDISFFSIILCTSPFHDHRYSFVVYLLSILFFYKYFDYLTLNSELCIVSYADTFSNSH